MNEQTIHPVATDAELTPAVVEHIAPTEMPTAELEEAHNSDNSNIQHNNQDNIQGMPEEEIESDQEFFERTVNEQVDYVLNAAIVSQHNHAICISKENLNRFPSSPFDYKQQYGSEDYLGCEADPSFLQPLTFTLLVDAKTNKVLTHKCTTDEGYIKQLELNKDLDIKSLGIAGHVNIDFRSHITYECDEEGKPINESVHNLQMVIRTFAFFALSALTSLKENIGLDITKENMLNVTNGYINNSLNIVPGHADDLEMIEQTHMGMCGVLYLYNNTLDLGNKEVCKLENLEFKDVKDVKFSCALQGSIKESALLEKYTDWSVVVLSKLLYSDLN